jgi:hypothetical protein
VVQSSVTYDTLYPSSVGHIEHTAHWYAPAKSLIFKGYDRYTLPVSWQGGPDLKGELR